MLSSAKIGIKPILSNDIAFRSKDHLYILQSQVLSTAPSIGTKHGPLAHHHGEDSQHAFHCHVDVDVEMIAIRGKELYILPTERIKK